MAGRKAPVVPSGIVSGFHELDHVPTCCTCCTGVKRWQVLQAPGNIVLVPRSCPDCAAPMELLEVPLARRAAVTLDRCARCGGVWFDFEEPEQVAQRALPFTPLEGASTTRRCPDCTLSLTPGLLPGATTVEMCSVCRGMWFDNVDLESLGSETLREAAPTPEELEPVSALGFRCARCGAETPWAQANGTAHGLVCAKCTPGIQPAPLSGPKRPFTLLEQFLFSLVRPRKLW